MYLLESLKGYSDNSFECRLGQIFISFLFVYSAIAIFKDFSLSNVSLNLTVRVVIQILGTDAGIVRVQKKFLMDHRF